MFIKKIIQGIFIAIIPQLIGIQDALETIIEDIVCPIFSEEYITEPEVYIDVTNQVFVNFSIVKQFPPEAQAEFQLLGASMGEYVIQTGFDLQVNFCETLDEPIILAPAFESLGFSASNCPAPIGIYGTQGYSLPTELFPDDFIPNKYLAILEFIYEDEKILVIHVYCNVH